MACPVPSVKLWFKQVWSKKSTNKKQDKSKTSKEDKSVADEITDWLLAESTETTQYGAGQDQDVSVSINESGKSHKKFSKTCLCHFLIVLLLAVVSVLLALFVVYVIVLFVLVPIDTAIDDAPDRLLNNVHNTILVFFGAAVTYKIFRDRNKSTFLNHLVKAQERMEKNTTDSESKIAGWDEMEAEAKQTEMAVRLLKAINAQGRGVPIGEGARN